MPVGRELLGLVPRVEHRKDWESETSEHGIAHHSSEETQFSDDEHHQYMFSVETFENGKKKVKRFGFRKTNFPNLPRG